MTTAPTPRKQKKFKGFYTGIGSRETPVWCRFAMQDIASLMALKGYVLRSGAAEGADTAFEIGCDKVEGRGEIYIPWKSFGTGSPRKDKPYYVPSPEQQERARQVLIGRGIIPHFDSMSAGPQKLHARNFYQVLGKGKKSVCCIFYANVDWITGDPEGGTASAVKLCKSLGIPVFNLQDPKDFDKIRNNLDQGILTQEEYILHQDNFDYLKNRLHRRTK